MSDNPIKPEGGGKRSSIKVVHTIAKHALVAGPAKKAVAKKPTAKKPVAAPKKSVKKKPIAKKITTTKFTFKSPSGTIKIGHAGILVAKSIPTAIIDDDITPILLSKYASRISRREVVVEIKNFSGKKEKKFLKNKKRITSKKP